ncbi:ras-related protein Rab-30-like [Limulus polyphemus]|uniref:Ras-related protein Rab-30-like n=1 Tax=Limulus polyphemus TaxID=6850 RepID=A0ABM1C642_LIMPO|nr:ras-related protein Rab-30-like [Limulus polyphemus]
MEDYKFLFKVVLIGNAGVGKTCLVRRFTQGLFPPGQGATIGVDFLIKTVQVDGEKVKLQIWDTAGQERFRSITQSYYRSAHALVLVYDISSQPSFDCLPMWLREMEQYANPKVFRALVGFSEGHFGIICLSWSIECVMFWVFPQLFEPAPLLMEPLPPSIDIAVHAGQFTAQLREGTAMSWHPWLLELCDLACHHHLVAYSDPQRIHLLLEILGSRTDSVVNLNRSQLLGFISPDVWC